MQSKLINVYTTDDHKDNIELSKSYKMKKRPFTYIQDDVKMYQHSQAPKIKTDYKSVKIQDPYNPGVTLEYALFMKTVKPPTVTQMITDSIKDGTKNEAQDPSTIESSVTPPVEKPKRKVGRPKKEKVVEQQ